MNDVICKLINSKIRSIKYLKKETEKTEKISFTLKDLPMK